MTAMIRRAGRRTEDSSADDAVRHVPRASRLPDIAGRFAFRLLLTVGLIVLLAPLVVVVITSFNKVPSLSVPPRHWSLSSYREIPSELYQAFYFSMKLGLIAAAISVFIGVPASFFLARRGNRLTGVLEGTFRLPLQAPQLVMGLAAFQFYVLVDEHTGIPLSSTWYGLLIAHIILLGPYIIVVCVPRICALDVALEQAGESLGAGRVRILIRIVFPGIRQAVLAAFVLAFLISFDNVPLSLFLTSPGSTTLPVALFDNAESSLSSVLYAAASLSLMVGVAAAVILDRVVGLRKVLS